MNFLIYLLLSLHINIIIKIMIINKWTDHELLKKKIPSCRMAGRTRNNNNGNGDGVSDGNVARIIRAIADRVRNIPPRNQDQSKSEMIAKYEKLHPHKFLGGSNPHEAEAWLRQIIKLLDTSDIWNERDRVTMATFQMEGEADHWWEMIKSTRQVETLTWR